MGKDYGEPIRYDPNFNGPIHKRSCTDIIWLLAFILYICLWGYVGYYGKTHGDIETLLAPMDSMGRRCGLNSYVEDKKYLVFFDISQCLRPDTAIAGCPTTQVCVKECPKNTILFDTQLTPASFETMKSSMVCTIDVNMNTLTYEQAKRHIQDGTCAKYVLKSQPVFRRCLVNVTEALEMVEEIYNATVGHGLDADQLYKHVNNIGNINELSAQIVQDLVQSRWYMAGGVVAVIVICFIYICLLRWVVAPVVWLSIGGFFALLGFGNR